MRKSICFFVGMMIGFWVPGAVPASGEAEHDHGHSGQGGQMLFLNTGGGPSVLVQMEHGAAPPTAGEPAWISFLVTDGNGRPFKDLVISHERLLHVVIISEDFSSFAHIHPEDFGPIPDEMKKSGRYPVRYVFPKAGRYLVAVDTAVQEAHISKQFHLNVEGEPKAGSVTKDFSRKKSFGEYIVKLTVIPEKIRAGEKTRLLYEITRNGKPVKDLEEYLGAPMHLAVVMTDLNGFIHAHGDVPGSAHDHIHAGHIHGTARENFGPEIEADVVFPEPGAYKIFGQVQHQKNVMLFDFMVQVE